MMIRNVIQLFSGYFLLTCSPTLALSLESSLHPFQILMANGVVVCAGHLSVHLFPFITTITHHHRHNHHHRHHTSLSSQPPSPPSLSPLPSSVLPSSTNEAISALFFLCLYYTAYGASIGLAISMCLFFYFTCMALLNPTAPTTYECAKHCFDDIHQPEKV